MSEKRQTLILLRWVLVIALSYLIIYSATASIEVEGACVALLLASNLVLMRLPPAAFHHAAFDLVLVGLDIGLTTLALWVCGGSGSDFYFMFFFVIFLASLGERVELTAVGAALAAGAYVFLLHGSDVWDTGMWLRVPFFLVTALTYGYLTTNARQARCRADAAEAVLALKTTFLATLSHEVRTPLNVIVGYTDMLREGLLGELVAAQRDALDKMSTHAFELLELVDRTLKASRLESGGMPVHLGEVHVDAVLEEVQLAVSRHCKADVDLSLRTQADIPPVVTDRLKLKEIVANLVTNALKYTDKGAVTVDARWAPRDRCVEIMVRDTGLGIRPEERQAIFEPFTRAREADARCTPGVGLGLFIVGRLIELLRGELCVESEPGCGSTFTVRIPQRLEEVPNVA